MQILYYASCFSDFLKIVNKLSLWLQSSTILFGNVKARVLKISEEVDELSNDMENAENFKKAEELLKFAEQCTELGMKRSYKQRSVSNCIQSFKDNFVQKFLADFKVEVSAAFSVNSDTLIALDMFSASDIDLKMPEKEDQTCLSTLVSFYGEKQVNEFKGAMKVSPAFIDSIATEMEKDDFAKEMSLAKMTFDMNKNSDARSLLK